MPGRQPDCNAVARAQREPERDAIAIAHELAVGRDLAAHHQPNRGTHGAPFTWPIERAEHEPECDTDDQSAKLRAVARAVARADHAPEQGANDERSDAGTDDKPVVAAFGRAKRAANDLGPND